MAFDVVIGIALVLGFMILIHEWGHFIVARWCGVRVDVFSIGFGPRLFGIKRGATDYRLSLLPLGGYVRMAGQDPSEIDSKERYSSADSAQQGPSGATDELMSKKRWQRALIAFAGPAVNLIFPILLLSIYFAAIGVPYSSYEDKPIRVAMLPSKAAGEPGSRLTPGDRVLSINDLKNPTWGKAEALIENSAAGSVLSVEVENAGSIRKLQIPIHEEDRVRWDRVLGFAPLQPILEDVASGYPAARAGLREGDKIVSVEGQPIQWWGQFTERVRGSQGQPVHVEVERGGKMIAIDVTPMLAQPEHGDSYYQIGVQVKDETAYKRVPVGAAVGLATSKTWEVIGETVGVVGKLVSGKVSVKQLQGAVGISHAAGQAVRKGTQAVISLMVLISVNLGVLNLLPIPILDGGQILLLSIEGLRRRDLSMAFKERFVQVGLVFLLVLFAYVMYNDVVRLLPGHS